VTACWAGAEHVATFTAHNALYDLAARYEIAPYHFPLGAPRWHGPALAHSPDGRLWYHRVDTRRGVKLRPSGVWWAITADELLGLPATGLSKGPRACVFPRQMPVRVEASMGDAKRGRRFAQKVAEGLGKQGFTIGPKGWYLRVTHQVVDSGKELTHGGPIEIPAFIPAVRFKWVLCDAEGNQVWERVTVGRFAFQGSKYYKGTTKEPIKGQPNREWIKAHFNFGGRPMRDAIVEEILDTQAKQPLELSGLPTMLLKIGREYRPLPLRINPVGEWPTPPQPGPRNRGGFVRVQE
jgi:hypothetical protein